MTEANRVLGSAQEVIEELKQEQQTQLRKINLLFDPAANDYKTIDFNGLYKLLESIAERERERDDNSGTEKK